MKDLLRLRVSSIDDTLVVYKKRGAESASN
jgi:hypothetical protein